MSADTCLNWITSQQNLLGTNEYGRNKRSIDQDLAAQRIKSNQIRDYRGEIDRSKFNDEKQRQAVDRAYSNLQVIDSKRLQCLTTLSRISPLEELFATLSNEFSEKSTELTSSKSSDVTETHTAHAYDGSIANSSQGCILAVRDTWAWINKLLKCSEVHLSHAAEYHQFFHDIKEYQHWMPAELCKAEELLSQQSLKRNAQAEETTRLLMEMKTALTMFLHWRGKVDALFERSRRIIPVYMRHQKLDHNRPVTSLACYRTNEISIKEGEEVTLIDNSKTQTWKVRNLRAQEAEVPSTILVIPGPDPVAVDAALRLCLQYLSTWTNMIKRIGSTIILFLLDVIREWTSEEERLLRALSDGDKKDLLHLFASIQQTFSPFWDKYPPYHLLRTRMQKTTDILALGPDPNFKDADSGKLLVIQTALLEDLLSRYRDFWSDWEKYKLLIETSQHPEYLLATKDWEDYKFVSTSDWLKKWGSSVNNTDEVDWSELGDITEQVTTTSVTETTVSDQTETEEAGSWTSEERYTMERERGTAESTRMTTSEQEEKQTFVITAVIDPRTGEEISLDKAINDRIINQAEGKYCNPSTGETMPIPTAMSAGKIKVEFTTVRKSAEKKQDIDLLTIKTYKEARPYTIKSVIDAGTEKKLSLDEAVKAGVIDHKRGVYRNKYTNEELSLADALDSGLLIVEFDSDIDYKANEPEIQIKTYAVSGVYDLKNKKRLSYMEAVQAGLVNQESGAYYNNITEEQEYIGEAIKRGHIKATVILDPNQLDVDLHRRVLMTDTALLDGFRQKLLQQPIAAMSALRKAATTNGINGTATTNGTSD